MKFACERKLFCCPLLLHLAPSLSTISCVNSCIESEIENVQRPRSALFSVFFSFFFIFFLHRLALAYLVLTFIRISLHDYVRTITLPFFHHSTAFSFFFTSAFPTFPSASRRCPFLFTQILVSIAFSLFVARQFLFSDKNETKRIKHSKHVRLSTVTKQWRSS